MTTETPEAPVPVSHETAFDNLVRALTDFINTGLADVVGAVDAARAIAVGTALQSGLADITVRIVMTPMFVAEVVLVSRDKATKSHRLFTTFATATGKPRADLH